MKLIRCTVEEIELEGDYAPILSTLAICQECDYSTESYGTHAASELRCLALMREGCPLKETNYYVNEREVLRLGTRVVNVKTDPYEVYIGRDMSKGSGIGSYTDGTFGNPVRVGGRCTVCYQRHETREDTLPCYQQLFYARIANAMKSDVDRAFLERVLELRDQVLGCWCKPDSCHGDIIQGFVDSEAADEWREWLRGVSTNAKKETKDERQRSHSDERHRTTKGVPRTNGERLEDERE